VPGIVCDVYGDTAVLRLDTPAVEELARAAARQLPARLPGIRRVLLQSGRRRTAGEPPQVLLGQPPRAPLVVREHGMRLEADVVAGQKTALYLDQRENRRRVRELAAGRSVLNLFAYSGGFTVAAALGGATRSCSVEQAGPATKALGRNLRLNGLAAAGHEVVEADAFAYLAAASERFDLVILDPPSLAPSRDAVPAALQAYRRLNTLALSRLEPGGILVTCSCSSHVGPMDFAATLGAAARAAGRELSVVEERGAGADHPWRPEFPEGRYLKVLVAYVR
jgi:23S rRNA (cytosine1962-C5)-methyltransferase